MTQQVDSAMSSGINSAMNGAMRSVTKSGASGGIDRAMGGETHGAAKAAAPRGPAANSLRPGVWRDFARLAAESFTIGLLVSVVLAVCVLMIAGSSRTADRDTSGAPRSGLPSAAAPIGEDLRGR